MARRVAFLCSGGGGNLRFIKRMCDLTGAEQLELCGVIVDRDCGALDYARAVGLSAVKIRYSRDDNSEMLHSLAALKADLIVSNVHQILDAAIVHQYAGRLINLHYSILPAFRGSIGTRPIRQALNSGCRLVGTTTHLLSEEVDAGKIICQSAIDVDPAKSFEVIVNEIFRSGCLNLANALYLTGGLGRSAIDSAFRTVVGKVHLFSPVLQFPTDGFDKQFWESIK